MKNNVAETKWMSFNVENIWFIHVKTQVCSTCSPGGSVVKNPPASAGDTGSIPGSGRPSGEGNGNSLNLPGKFHGQKNLAISVYGVAKSQT